MSKWVDPVYYCYAMYQWSFVLFSSSVNVKKVSLELGGKSPLIIFSDCDMDKAVRLVSLETTYVHSSTLPIPTNTTPTQPVPPQPIPHPPSQSLPNQYHTHPASPFPANTTPTQPVPPQHHAHLVLFLLSS